MENSALTKEKLISIIKEEISKSLQENWKDKLKELQQELDLYLNDEDKEEPQKALVSPGLDLRHKKSKIVYTVAKVEPDRVWLKNPKGKLVSATEKQLKQFELD